jgi:hypothetical protein
MNTSTVIPSTDNPFLDRTRRTTSKAPIALGRTLATPSVSDSKPSSPQLQSTAAKVISVKTAIARALRSTTFSQPLAAKRVSPPMTEAQELSEPAAHSESDVETTPARSNSENLSTPTEMVPAASQELGRVANSLRFDESSRRTADALARTPIGPTSIVTISAQARSEAVLLAPENRLLALAVWDVTQENHRENRTWASPCTSFLETLQILKNEIPLDEETEVTTIDRNLRSLPSLTEIYDSPTFKKARAEEQKPKKKRQADAAEETEELLSFFVQKAEHPCLEQTQQVAPPNNPSDPQWAHYMALAQESDKAAATNAAKAEADAAQATAKVKADMEARVDAIASGAREDSSNGILFRISKIITAIFG